MQDFLWLFSRLYFQLSDFGKGTQSSIEEI